ncbi:MAG: oligoendopeptidase F [Chloroflexota bacterium]|nr:oligoendopeptidase F [Chloroflexota bacterium]
MTATLPTRSEIPAELTWDLTPVYADNSRWEADFAAIEPLLDELGGYQGRLGADAATLLAATRLQDRIHQQVYQLAVYAMLKRDEDTTDATYQALADRAQQLMARVGAAGSFVRPELLALPDGTLDRLQAEEPDLQLYAHVFADLLREKPHVLSAAEENLLAGMSEIAAAPGTVFAVLNNADMTYGTVTDESGAEVALTHGRYGRFMQSQQRPLRAEAFLKMHATYQAHRNTCAALYAANVKANVFQARTRKYGSALEAALYGDNVPTTVYTNLIETVHEGLPLLHRYLDLRRRVLGVEQLHMYDLHVPLIGDTAAQIPYAEARQTVLDALRPLGATYGEAAAKGLTTGRWVDVYETPNKRSGAYSWGAYTTPPYILLNYQDTLNDVFTLAHELGHAMHSYFTRQGQPFVYGNYTIFVAEVASTLNEALLTHQLLQQEGDPKLRLAVVNNDLDGFRATLYRQTMFAEFEKLTHEAAEAGESLTADRLSELYYGLNKLYYGEGVVSDETIAIEWARIPHFYSSFYVYKYATGISAANALAQGIIREGQPAVDRYLRFLGRGSSTYSIDLLRDAGVDMASPAPVSQALGVFSGMLDEMERLLGETGHLPPATATA